MCILFVCLFVLTLHTKKYSVAFSHWMRLSWDIKLLVHKLFPEKLCVAMVLLSSQLSCFEKEANWISAFL